MILGKDFLPRVTNSKFWAVWLFQLHHICPNSFGYVQIGLSKIYRQNVRSKLSYELAIIGSWVARLLLGKFWAVWLFQLHHICPNSFGYVQIGLSKIYRQNVRSKLFYELAIIGSWVARLLLGKFWAVWLFQLHHICPNSFGYVQIGLSKIYAAQCITKQTIKVLITVKGLNYEQKLLVGSYSYFGIYLFINNC